MHRCRPQDFGNGDPLCLYWFHQFMERNSVTPAEVGCSSGWAGCGLINRTEATTLPMRRRLYWSLRFPSWYEARSCECRRQTLRTADSLPVPQLTLLCVGLVRAQRHVGDAECLHSQRHCVRQLE